MDNQEKSKVTKLERKLFATKLLVLTLLEIKASLSSSQGPTGSSDPPLPVDPCKPVVLWKRIKMMMRNMKLVLDPYTPLPKMMRMMSLIRIL